MGLITLKLPEKLQALIDEKAREYGMSRSDFIRQALIFYLVFLNEIEEKRGRVKCQSDTWSG